MAKVLSNLRITQHYGNNGHSGVDLGSTSDRKVYANSSGTVEQIQTGYGNLQGSTGMASYGNMVLIKHPNGMKTRYAHLAEVWVKVGQYVSAGQQIGVQGNTGNGSARSAVTIIVQNMHHLSVTKIYGNFCENVN